MSRLAADKAMVPQEAIPNLALLEHNSNSQHSSLVAVIYLIIVIMAPESSPIHVELISRVSAYVEKHMSNYDASHDFQHIQRVLALSNLLAKKSCPPTGEYDHLLITLSALLHDVGDRKYLLPGQDGTTLVQSLLVEFGADESIATAVQEITSAVSYTSEVKNPEKVLEVLAKHPELGVVQDADRLDAIGAVGVARCFTFGGAKSSRSLGDSVGHFVEKLEKLEGMMKTDGGKEMARVRTERMKVFRGWWEEETMDVII